MAIDNMEEQRSAKALETEKQLLLLQLRKQELDNFLNAYGNYDQEEDGCIDNDDVIGAFYFFTADSRTSGSYWYVHSFQIIDDDNKIIISINDWG